MPPPNEGVGGCFACQKGIGFQEKHVFSSSFFFFLKGCLLDTMPLFYVPCHCLLPFSSSRFSACMFSHNTDRWPPGRSVAAACQGFSLGSMSQPFSHLSGCLLDLVRLAHATTTPAIIATPFDQYRHAGCLETGSHNTACHWRRQASLSSHNFLSLHACPAFMPQLSVRGLPGMPGMPCFPSGVVTSFFQTMPVSTTTGQEAGNQQRPAFNNTTLNKWLFRSGCPRPQELPNSRRRGFFFSRHHFSFLFLLFPSSLVCLLVVGQHLLAAAAFWRPSSSGMPFSPAIFFSDRPPHAHRHCHAADDYRAGWDCRWETGNAFSVTVFTFRAAFFGRDNRHSHRLSLDILSLLCRFFPAQFSAVSP